MIDARYFQFPICMLDGLFDNKVNVLNDILHYGLMKYATTIKPKKSDIVRQLYYDYWRGNLEGDLKSILDSNILNDNYTGWYDEDYNGFCGRDFVVPDEFVKLYDNTESLHYGAMVNYIIDVSYSFYNIANKNHIDKRITYKTYIEYMKGSNESEAYGMIRDTLLFKFRDNDVNQFELVQLAAYIAMNSILGTKQYIKTNKLMVFARMFGYKRHLDSNVDHYDIGVFAKYSNRYHFDRLKTQLELNWNLIIYSFHTRGFYIARKSKVKLEDLILFIERNKHKNKVKKLKEDKRAARNKATNLILGLDTQTDFK